MKLNERALAAQILNQVLPLVKGAPHTGRSLSDLLPKTISEYPDADKPFLQVLCFGVCRWFTRLDKLAQPLIQKPFKPRDSDIHGLLLVGLFQLYYLRVPDHAAIAETVEACRQLNKTWAVKVINGMLRSAQRKKDELESQLSDSLPIQTAHPKWLTDLLTSAWPDQAEQILSENNQQAPMSIRVNRLHASRDSYLLRLQENNLQAVKCRFSEDGLQLEKPCSVELLPGFEAGDCFVQDEAAQLAATLLAPKAGERILDACAAPGGKTTHIAELAPDLQDLIALDMDAARASKITENLERLKLTATVVPESLEQYVDSWDGQPFDRILLDAPCSAIGVIRRHPDIKWLRKRGDISALAIQQLDLLSIAWTLLKPGGRLVYATCSILPQENERVVMHFLQQQEDAREEPIKAEWGVSAGVGRQLFPQPNGHDGFYYAVLKRL